MLYSNKFINYVSVNSAMRTTAFLAQDLLTVPRTGRRNDCFHSPDEDFRWKSKRWGTNNFLVI